jgi:hypothetical protein
MQSNILKEEASSTAGKKRKTITASNDQKSSEKKRSKLEAEAEAYGMTVKQLMAAKAGEAREWAAICASGSSSKVKPRSRKEKSADEEVAKAYGMTLEQLMAAKAAEAREWAGMCASGIDVKRSRDVLQNMQEMIGKVQALGYVKYNLEQEPAAESADHVFVIISICNKTHVRVTKRFRRFGELKEYISLYIFNDKINSTHKRWVPFSEQLEYCREVLADRDISVIGLKAPLEEPFHGTMSIQTVMVKKAEKEERMYELSPRTNKYVI